MCHGHNLLQHVVEISQQDDCDYFIPADVSIHATESDKDGDVCIDLYSYCCLPSEENSNDDGVFSQEMENDSLCYFVDTCNSNYLFSVSYFDSSVASILPIVEYSTTQFFC